MPYKETYAHAFVTAQKSSVTALESRDIPLNILSKIRLAEIEEKGYKKVVG